MTEVPFNCECPSCGFQFSAGTLMAGSYKLEGANGVCCMCAEVFRINDDHTLRILTCKEYLYLNPQDAYNIAMLVAHARREIETRKAQARAAAN